MPILSRRTALRLIAGFSSLLAVPAATQRAAASADKTRVREAINAFAGEKTPVESRIELDIPLTADNANAVPVSVKIDSPMTTESYCEEVLLIAEKNPRPTICGFRFSPGLSVPQINTRIRLAESQPITALARMNDGSVFIARKHIIVTIGGCG